MGASSKTAALVLRLKASAGTVGDRISIPQPSNYRAPLTRRGAALVVLGNGLVRWFVRSANADCDTQSGPYQDFGYQRYECYDKEDGSVGLAA